MLASRFTNSQTDPTFAANVSSKTRIIHAGDFFSGVEGFKDVT
jgi:hypothetical protein